MGQITTPGQKHAFSFDVPTARLCQIGLRSVDHLELHRCREWRARLHVAQDWHTLREQNSRLVVFKAVA